MRNEIKANKVRTLLLLNTESDVEHFKSNKTKMNSISPHIYYNMYTNIEINIENPCESFSIDRKFILAQNLINKEKNEIEIEFTPIIEVEYKLKKKLISERKNQNFFKNLSNLDSSPLSKTSQCTNENPVSSNHGNTPFNIYNFKNNDNSKSSIHFLRQLAKHLIRRRKKTKMLNALRKNENVFKSQKNLSVIIMKNSKKNDIEKYNKNKSSKNVNFQRYIKQKSPKNSPTFGSMKNKEISHLVHSYFTSYENNNFKNKCKNLLLENKNMITSNGPSFNRKIFTLMNVQLEKEKLIFKKE